MDVARELRERALLVGRRAGGQAQAREMPREQHEHDAQVAHDRKQQPAQAFAVAVAVLFGMQRPHLHRRALAFEQRGDLRDIRVSIRGRSFASTAGNARRIAAAVTSPSAPRRASEPSVSASTAGGSGASAKGSPVHLQHRVAQGLRDGVRGRQRQQRGQW